MRERIAIEERPAMVGGLYKIQRLGGELVALVVEDG